jgi:hypothetical protein
VFAREVPLDDLISSPGFEEAEQPVLIQGVYLIPWPLEVGGYFFESLDKVYEEVKK